MVKGYSRVQIALHWLIAAMVIFEMIFGDSMTHIWFRLRRDGHADMTIGGWVHIIVGIAVIFLVVWRVALRFIRGVPPVPDSQGPLVQFAGMAGHWLLNFLALAMPISGLLVWYGGVEALSRWHADLIYALILVMILAHISAAFWHQYILKDGLIRRMMAPEE